MKDKTKYWLWYWGFSQDDLTIHSPKKKFFDFDKMKDYSANHSAKHQWISGYWSDYDQSENDDLGMSGIVFEGRHDLVEGKEYVIKDLVWDYEKNLPNKYSYKINWKHLKSETPRFAIRIGNTLLALSTFTAGYQVIQDDKQYAAIAMVVGLVSKALCEFFKKEENDKETI